MPAGDRIWFHQGNGVRGDLSPVGPSGVWWRKHQRESCKVRGKDRALAGVPDWWNLKLRAEGLEL